MTPRCPRGCAGPRIYERGRYSTAAGWAPEMIDGALHSHDCNHVTLQYQCGACGDHDEQVPGGRLRVERVGRAL